jgi:hypothetical protein
VEFSKKLVILLLSVALLLTGLVVLFPALGLAADGLYIATPLAWTAFDVAAGLYYWKSKNENRSKYTQKFVKQLAEKYGIDAALRAAEIVLKD